MPKTPTSIDQHTAYSALYTYFNEKLFKSTLAPVMLNFDRHAKAFGFFVPDRWVAGKTIAHEISLNPNYLGRDFRATCATLVHEMCHAWQAEHGTPGRGGYHNHQWGSKMKEVGLHPSSTGEKGGRETGDRVTHYIVEDGPFARAYDKLPQRYRLPFLSFGDAEKTKKPKPASKVKYTCPGCDANAWGKPGLLIQCADTDAHDDGSAELMEPGEVTG
jgi:hypothetical protein